jgi:hypothetical protein
MSRDRAKLHWIAADFTDLDPELAVIKLFERDYRLEGDK